MKNAVKSPNTCNGVSYEGKRTKKSPLCDVVGWSPCPHCSIGQLRPSGLGKGIRQDESMGSSQAAWPDLITIVKLLAVLSYIPHLME